MKARIKLYAIAVIMALTLCLSQVNAQSLSASTVKKTGGEDSNSNVKLNSGFPTITGSGTPDRIPRFTAGTVIRDSIITQSKSNNIGIDTTTPTSKLTVAGMIETTLNGVKFPDGTVQTTAAISSPALVNPAQTAFQREFSLTLPVNQFSATDQISVPAGKRLVVEYISILVLLSDTSNYVALFGIETTVDGVNLLHRIQPVRLEPNAGTCVLDKQVRIYADGGTDVVVRFSRLFDSDQGFAAVTISGHLVDMP